MPQPDLFFEFLGSIELAAAANTMAVNIAARQALLMDLLITGFSGADFLNITFNGDGGLNYVTRLVTCAAGGTTLVDAPAASQGGALPVGVGTQTTGYTLSIFITNPISTSKVATLLEYLPTGAPATVPALRWGGFEWVNTTARITQIRVNVGGANNFLAGSGFSVYGRNNL